MKKILFLLIVLSQIAMGSWGVSTYRDSFGEPTKSRFVTNNNWIEGTYFYVREGELYVNIHIDEDSDVGIFLHQGDNQKRAERFERGNIRVRNEKGENFSSAVTEQNKTLGIRLLRSQEFINFLKRSNNVRAIVEETLSDGKVLITYNFTIDTVGLNQKLKEIGL